MAIIIGSTAAVGLVLALLGWRGRRVDEHPCCRRCGYDLVGSGEQPATCPECGRTLRSRRAVRVGRRRRYRSLVGVGGALVVVALAAGGWQGWVHGRQVDWNRVKPAWLLTIEAEGDDRVRSDAALHTLIDRLESGRLSDTRVERLIDTALERQADWDRQWRHGWAVLVESARAAARIDDARWARYARQGVKLDLVVRPVVRKRDPLPRKLEVRTRFAAFKEQPVRINRSYDVESVTFEGYPVSLVGRVTGRRFGVESALPQLIDLGYSGRAARRDAVGLRLTNEIHPGPATLECVVHFVQSELDGPTLEWTEHVAAEIDIVEADCDLSTMIDLYFDDALEKAIEASLMADDCVLSAQLPSPRITGDVNFTAPPVPFAFDVYCRAGGLEWHVGSVVSQGMQGPVFRDQFGGYIGVYEVDSVDIILRPSLEAATTTFDVTRIWGGEVVLSDVPVLTVGRRQVPDSR